MAEVALFPAPAPLILTSSSLRKNGLPFFSLLDPHTYPSIPGKQWHAQKSAFRPRAGQSTYNKRTEERQAMATMKAKEKEMKDEKEAERQVRNLSRG
jgi:hypothetical protein